MNLKIFNTYINQLLGKDKNVVIGQLFQNLWLSGKIKASDNRKCGRYKNFCKKVVAYKPKFFFKYTCMYKYR
jgi:hypothetical protein